MKDVLNFRARVELFNESACNWDSFKAGSSFPGILATHTGKESSKRLSGSHNPLLAPLLCGFCDG